jgi:heavy metal translocating P-type ATPase
VADAPFAGRSVTAIALLALAALALHLGLRFGLHAPQADWPLLAALALGGGPLVAGLAARAWRGEFGSDLLAGLSIATSVWLGEYLAGTLVVLMLSGGEALEAFAVRRASSSLEALARRMPSRAHRVEDGRTRDIGIEEIRVGDQVLVLPHEICPVDGEVVEGRGSMDESYLTGEPYIISKAPGAAVLSGAINGEHALLVRATRLAVDSRYARIMEVMRASEQKRPRLRRLADSLGAWYTPLALALALAAWGASGEPTRFLAVLVIATPCPLLIAIPVAIIGSISLAARRGIVIKNPAVLEQVDTCRTMILDKTGTLTCGRPRLTEVTPLGDLPPRQVLAWAASLERLSKHPLAQAVVEAATAEGLADLPVTEVREAPGQGLSGVVEGHRVALVGRDRLDPASAARLPPGAGLECVVLVDGRPAAHYRFRDEPRRETPPFIRHLERRHGFGKVMIVSGDRLEEVRHLAERVGIREVHAAQAPEDKVEIVRAETGRARTLFVGDGINDAPALAAATVGVAFGHHSDVTAEAAGAVIMESSIARLDEFLHIGARMRRIALQSAVGGMLLSILGMLAAALGYLPPVAGAIGQEIIDLLAVLNALRAAFPPPSLTDFS